MKKSLVFALAIMLLLTFASSAMAAQTFAPVAGEVYTKSVQTPAAFVYGPVTAPTAYNSALEYPFGIYLPNANAPANYRIHSNYAKNTDACASCHSTHTAVGNNLLQWYNTYDTCLACHDGTVSTTYDVVTGTIATTNSPAMGGAFGGTALQFSSAHIVDGSFDITAAPGGGATGIDSKNWGVAFGCESCHTPHGNGGNARILNPNVNNVAELNKAVFKVSTTGYVYDGVDTKGVYILKNYPFNPVIKKDGSVVSGAYILNTSGVSQVVYDGYTVDATYRVEGTPALQVEMNVQNYLQANESVQHLSGMNAFCGACHTDYNTENQSHTSDKLSGEYSQAHRHQVGTAPKYNTAANLGKAGMVLEGNDADINNNKLECLTCHVAHGVNSDYWNRTVGAGAVANGKLATAYLTPGELVELSGSSALKRLPNMGTCEACHQKGTSAEGYTANADSIARALDINTMPNTYNLYAVATDYPANDKAWVGSATCLQGCHKDKAGWANTMHQSSSHTGTMAYGCNSCHNPGNTIINIGTFAVGQVDSGITCEACHGAGKNHIAAPSALNIFNPATASIERQAIECGKCHDMFNNTPAYTTDSYGLATVSGMSYDFQGPLGIGKTKLADLVNKVGWSVAYRAYENDPAKFANATQVGATSTHYGGAWGYADSKHFKGSGTSENPNGVVSCNTCHDMHSDTHTGLLKFEYSQICATCHDSLSVPSTYLPKDVAMPTNNWNRHQIEANDYAHSFKFGAPATVAAVTIETVNLENATGGITNTFKLDGGTVTAYTIYDAAYGTGGLKENNLWRSSQTGGGGVGERILAYSDAGRTTRVYNNYAMDWEVISSPAAAAGSFVLVPEGGALEFTNPGLPLSNFAKFSGAYTLKYTNRYNPSVTGTVYFQIKQTPNIN